MIPRRRLLLLALLPAAPLALLAWAPELSSVALAANLLLVTLAAADLLLTPNPLTIEVVRESPEVLSAGAPNPVRLHVANRSREPVDLELFDEAPAPCQTAELPLRLHLPPGTSQTAVYHVIPRQRGHNTFAAVHLRYPSRLGLWMRQERRRLPSPVRIYPDIRAVRRFDLLARRNHLQDIGLKFWRVLGQGGEFERLREYRRGDQVRHIDWKATAKHQRLVTRQYTVERNQNVFFLLDCGRTMANETDGLSHLDRALNAALILSYIGLGQGDSVALMAFSNRVELSVGPLRSKGSIQALIQATFDLHPRLEASDYGMACEELLRRQRKRALVLLLTHALDEHHMESLGRYVKSLTSPHLLLLAFLKDVSLARMASRVPGRDVDAFEVAAAAEILNAQARRVRELRAAGALVVETMPDALSPVLINEYLDVKARHLL